jgi:ABC-type Fe3+ transport system substrate-binding protein
LRKFEETKKAAVNRVAGYPLDDPDGYYTGFAVSGYGVMWNTEYLARYNLKAPEKWDDLAKPAYAGHLAITAPSRSGTTHLIVEIILQSKGWKEGWNLLLKMSGNLATVTARSFGVRDGIRAGRFGTGPVIDFFGFSSIATGKPIGFAYPAETVLLPANIAVVQGARNLPAAAAFIRFLISAEGQRMLFKPEISRLPVRPDVYEGAPENIPNPFDGSIRTKGLIFDSNLSRQRYHLVNTLFDILITHRLTAAKAAWHSLRKADAMFTSLPDPVLLARLDKARELLTQVPVSSERSQQTSINGKFSRKKPGFAVSDYQAALEAKWIGDAKSRYVEARRIADDVRSVLAERQRESQTQ